MFRIPVKPAPAAAVILHETSDGDRQAADHEDYIEAKTGESWPDVEESSIIPVRVTDAVQTVSRQARYMTTEAYGARTAAQGFVRVASANDWRTSLRITGLGAQGAVLYVSPTPGNQDNAYAVLAQPRGNFYACELTLTHTGEVWVSGDFFGLYALAEHRRPTP